MKLIHILEAYWWSNNISIVHLLSFLVVNSQLLPWWFHNKLSILLYNAIRTSGIIAVTIAVIWSLYRGTVSSFRWLDLLLLWLLIPHVCLDVLVLILAFLFGVWNMSTKFWAIIVINYKCLGFLFTIVTAYASERNLWFLTSVASIAWISFQVSIECSWLWTSWVLWNISNISNFVLNVVL